MLVVHCLVIYMDALELRQVRQGETRTCSLCFFVHYGFLFLLFFMHFMALL